MNSYTGKRPVIECGFHRKRLTWRRGSFDDNFEYNRPCSIEGMKELGQKVGSDWVGGLGLAKGLRGSDTLESDCRIKETVVP